MRPLRHCCMPRTPASGSTRSPTATRGADIEDAYAIGQMVTDAKVAAGRVVKGHKVGLTSKAMRSTSGATEPDYGNAV